MDEAEHPLWLRTCVCFEISIWGGSFFKKFLRSRECSCKKRKNIYNGRGNTELTTKSITQDTKSLLAKTDQ